MTSSMLDRFAKAKQREIDALARDAAKGKAPKFYTGERPSFSGAIREKGPGAVIAEYKRASPSKGEINLKLKPAKVAEMYKRGGAAAVSVLTEEDHFKGELGFLKKMRKAGLPMLRKDFILDPLQIAQTASTPASAVLLIARMFADQGLLAKMAALAGASGVEPVVEIFDEDDLASARKAGADIIQVNNRDLDTLATSLDVSRRLINHKREGELWISASGVSEPDQVRELASLGFDALLVGTSLMASEDPEAALAALAALAAGGKR